MSETPFFKTRMGHQFYERTMPALVKQLERLNELLERLVRRQQREDKEQSPAVPVSSTSEEVE